MKTLINFRLAASAFLVILFASLSSFAGIGGTDSNATSKSVHSLEVSIVPQDSPKTFRIAFRNESSNPVVISVYDNKHKQLLHKKTVNNTEVGFKKYNFTQFPSGQYTIELSNSNEKYSQVLQF